MAEYFGYTQFFSRNVRYQSKADTSEHIIFYGARDLKEITLSPLLPNLSKKSGDRLSQILFQSRLSDGCFTRDSPS